MTFSRAWNKTHSPVEMSGHCAGARVYIASIMGLPHCRVAEFGTLGGGDAGSVSNIFGDTGI